MRKGNIHEEGMRGTQEKGKTRRSHSVNLRPKGGIVVKKGAGNCRKKNELKFLCPRKEKQIARRDSKGRE